MGKICSLEKIKATTIIVILIGFIGIFASAFFTESIKPEPGSLYSAFSGGLTTLSIALIAFGIFGILLDSHSWREYFGERLKEVVIDNAYINNLDPENLKQLQTNVLKAQFKNTNIDKDGGFLQYFHLHLHKFISEPYREDVSTEVIMREISKGGDFLVTDKVRYVCRSSGGKIQSSIGWRPDPDEFKEIRSLKVNIQFPANHEKAGQIIELKKCECVEKEGISVSLKEYENIDGLVVITESIYVVERSKFQYWQMAHPTKNFDITIIYPSDLKIQFKTLVLEDVISHITEDEGYLKFGYGTWALPQSGLTWLIKNP